MRVLFIAEPHSVHAIRWMAQFKDSDWDIHLTPGIAGRNTGASTELNFGTLHHVEGLSAEVKAQTGEPMIQTPADEVTALQELLVKLQPDIIHILGLCVNMQNRGISICGARDLHAAQTGRRIPILYSSWGADLAYFGQLPEHRPSVEKVVSSADFYLSECRRDLRLATEFGFRGQCLGFLPAFGGATWYIDPSVLQPVNSRPMILLKGRDQSDGDPIGRAMTMIYGLAMVPDVFENRMIGILQADLNIQQWGRQLGLTIGVKTELFPRLPTHDAVLHFMGQSIIFGALTTNDGLPSSLVEAMSFGTFPIHSDLEPIREWITDGENGLLVDPHDPIGTARAFHRALTSPELLTHAAAMNQRLVREKLSDAVVRPQAYACYLKILQRAAA